MAKDAVLVTGAAGSVGHFLVEHLRQAGYGVVATDRPGAPLPEASATVAVQPEDLTAPGAPARLVQDVGMVIHTAALIDIGLPFERLEAVNVTAPRELFAAAERAGVRRFVFFSSGSIYKKDATGTYTEEKPIAGSNDYERTKVMCEEYLLREARPKRTEVVVVRPSLIYGPRGKMLGAALACIPPIVHEHLRMQLGFSGGPRSNWVHAEDVARAAAHLLEKGEAGEAYNVGDDDPIPFGEVVNVAVEAYGFRPAARIPFPPLGLMRVLATQLVKAGFVFNGLNRGFDALWERICRKYDLRCELHPKLDKEAMPYAYQDTIFPNDKVKQTGFSFKYPSFRDGFGPTVKWYQAERWVPTY